MENQHRKISGYRDLTQEEIDLINAAKELESKCLQFHDKVRYALEAQSIVPEERERQVKAQVFRWHAIARTDLETSFMALIRSIAQPQPK